MSWLELPHTRGCLVCGKDNPHGLHLCSTVEADTGAVHLRFVPRAEHIGFQGIVHGGLLATLIDEAMVWAATWPARQFCVSAELTVRYRRSAAVGRALLIEARIEARRSRLIETVAEVKDVEAGHVIANGAGKYAPMPREQNALMMASLVEEPETAAALARLRTLNP